MGEDDDNVDADCVRTKVGKSAGKTTWRVATWNFSGCVVNIKK